VTTPNRSILFQLIQKNFSKQNSSMYILKSTRFIEGKFSEGKLFGAYKIKNVPPPRIQHLQLVQNIALRPSCIFQSILQLSGKSKYLCCKNAGI